MNNETRQPPRHRGHMGPPGAGGGEKANDFSGTWKKLLNYCRKYIFVMIIAIICASIGTVCTLLGPDKLSEMTDAIATGVKPDTDKLTEITETMSKNVASNFSLIIDALTSGTGDQSGLMEKAIKIMASDDISDEDKELFKKTMSALRGTGDQQSAIALVLALPEDILVKLLDPVKVNDSVISPKDQVDTLKIIMDTDTTDGEALGQAMSKMPDSVKKALYTDITIDGKVISGDDQIKMLDVLKDMDSEDSSAAVKKMNPAFYQDI